MVAWLACSCASYKQNIMFKVPDEAAVKKQVDLAEKSYVVQKNDRLELQVYTNDGERLLDPDEYLKSERPPTATEDEPQQYLVGPDGSVKFPLVGVVKIEGLSLRQAEEILQQEFQKFYQKPMVILTYVSKRVVVLGATGGQVIPLVDENTRLVEILATAKGISNDAKAHNIRVLRGNEYFVADFSTIEGYQKGNMVMEPGDVIYVEPIRRPFSEGLRDYGPLVSIITSLTTLIVVIVSL